MFCYSQDETDKMDIFHKAFKVIRGVPCSTNVQALDGVARVLDIGTGTGFWANDYATWVVSPPPLDVGDGPADGELRWNKPCYVIGIDQARIQPLQ